MNHDMIEETLLLALAYVQYVRDKDPELHREANGSDEFV